MAINDFAELFSNRYQDIIGKALVAMKIANTRFEAKMSYGDTFHRTKLDLSGVLVRDVVNLTDQTIDAITDSDETILIDQKKGAAFPIADWEKLQAGNLPLAETAGKEVALKVQRYVDASVLSETVNATYKFDTGDLTTGNSSGVPLVLTTTNAAQFLSRLKAKLKRNNADSSQMCLVLDPDTMSVFEQTLMGKSIDLAGNIFKNGYSGTLLGFEVYESNNLTGEAVLSMATQPTTSVDTVTINGVTFTFVTALSAGPAVAGEVVIGGSADAARANLTAAINACDTTTTTFTALSAADQIKIKELRITATNDNSANTMTIVAIGSGRLVLSETFTDGTDAWSKNFVHIYAGRKGAIDVVIQDNVKPVMREEPKQRTMNILTDVLYGKKTFADGALYFLDTKIDSTSV